MIFSLSMPRWPVSLAGLVGDLIAEIPKDDGPT